MGSPRRYDHDEAYSRFLAGETFQEIAASYGVNQNAIRALVKRRDPEQREKLNEYSRNRQRDTLRLPCVRGCGRLAWHLYGRSGVCIECERADRRAEALARNNHGTETRYSLGCRCDDCRRGASEAKRLRRERSRVPCSHGCGRMVDGINRRTPGKPTECQPCARRRIQAERQRKAAA